MINYDLFSIEEWKYALVNKTEAINSRKLIE